MPVETKTTIDMKTKLKIAALGAIVAAGCIAGISKSRTAESSAITMANVEALTRRESDKTSGCLIDKWEDKYLSHNKKGELIWIVEGATVCYEDMGDEPECYESYYFYEEPY